MNEELIAALKESCGFEVVTFDVDNGTIRIAGRVPADASRWKAVKDRLLIAAAEGRLAAADVSQWHFRRKVGGEDKTVYLWRIVVKDDASVVADVIQRKITKSFEEAQSGVVKLQMSDSRAGVLPNGKGAQIIRPVG